MVIKNMCTLEEVAIETILNSDQDVGYLWNFEMIPNIIRKKKCLSTIDKIVYSFHPVVLQEVWKCPPEYLEKYAQNIDLNSLLDKIIFGKPIDILSIPPSILKLLDRRYSEICDTSRYKRHFQVFDELDILEDELDILEDELDILEDEPDELDILEDELDILEDEIDILEDEDGNTLSVTRTIVKPHFYNPNVYFYPT